MVLSPNYCLNFTKQAETSSKHHFQLLRECYCQLETESPKYVLKTAFLLVILIITFFGNSLVCAAVLLYRRLHTVTNYFILSLAISDLLLSLLSLPFRIDENIHNDVWCHSLEICQTWLLIDQLCSSASMWHLAIISIDRYVAICIPFRYYTIMTNRTGIILIGFVWLNSLIWALLALINWTAAGEAHWGILWPLKQPQCSKRDPVFYSAAAAFNFFLPLIIVILMYTLVFRVAWSQARAVAVQQQSSSRQNNNAFSITKELKAARTLAIVVGAFVSCWFPFFVILLTDLWSTRIRMLKPDTVAKLFLTFAFVLPVLNSALNPVIYAVLNRAFRSAFKNLFVRCFKRSS